MKTKFNRFALLPFTCNSCHRIIWLEPYRKAEVFEIALPSPGFNKIKICDECIVKYNIKDVKDS